MNQFTKSILKVLQSATNAFKTYPASLFCALMFAIVTIIRIALDWPQQEPYNFLFNCLHWSFALGAIFSLAAITAAQSLYNTRKTFLAANFIGVVLTAFTFVVLYYFGGIMPKDTSSIYSVISNIYEARVSIAILISLLVFMVLAGYPKEHSSFADSFFMTHKAFFIALLYGLVIMGGTTGVASAFQTLIYRDMSTKVYMYLGTISGFLAYAIFTGYFPDFRKGQIDEHREVAQKQPRFIEILFGYILTPIMLALTLVLLIWAGKTVLAGMNAPFMMLTEIAVSYAIGGTWLYVMTSNHHFGLVNFYRKIYPIAALIILAFEAWAIVIQFSKWGLQTSVYSFIIIWIGATAASILLLLMKEKAYHKIVAVICLLAVVWVLPYLGFHALPVTVQTNRLEQMLINNKILVNGKIAPAEQQPTKDIQEKVTDLVNFLANTQNPKLPVWFDKNLNDGLVFRNKLGFEKAWPEPEKFPGGNNNYMESYVIAPSNPVNITGYQWAINLLPENIKENNNPIVVGKNGTYSIHWLMESNNGIPVLKIYKNDKIIVEKNLREYIDTLSRKYPPSNTYMPKTASFDEMLLKFETTELRIMIVFNSFNINVDPQNDRINYNLNPGTLYLSEN